MAELILVIEDDQQIVDLLRVHLGRGGFGVISASDANEGVRLLRARTPQLVILDVMLPGKSGFEMGREIRKESQVPIIMLTSRHRVEDRVEGLDLGADDYLLKPFQPEELLARIRSVLRRHRAGTPAQEQHVCGGFVFNLRKRSLLFSGKTIELSKSEFEALLFLAQNANEVVSRDQLLQYLKGVDCEFYDRSIDTLISRLRMKLEDEAKNPKVLKTVRGKGYTFMTGKIAIEGGTAQ